MASSNPEMICKEFISRSAEFFQSRQFTDCTFLVGSSMDQEHINAHKLILAVISPVFEAMLYGILAEENHQVPVPDMNPEDFKELLNYVYTNKVNLRSIDQAMGVYYGAKKYMLPHLQDLCSNYLEANMEPSNVLQLYEFSQLFEDIKLQYKATKIFIDSTKLVLNDPSFEEINISTLVYIFSLDKLSITNEMDLFKAALQYLQNKDAQGKDNKLDTSEDQADDLTIHFAVQNIRFLTLTPKEFAEVPVKSKLISESEEHSILLNIVSSDTTVPYPLRLSENKQRRNKITTITFKLQDIKNVRGRENSSPVIIDDSPWNLMVVPKLDKGEQFLGVFLVSNAESNEEGWSCKVTRGELRLCSQKWCCQDLSKVIEHNFTKTEPDWGFARFIQWDILVDPDQGYIKDGAIILEADFDAETPTYI